MLKELELKQKQLLKLLQSRDQTETRRKVAENHMLLNGRMDESQELLNLFARECKEDMKDIKMVVKESSNELDRLHREIQVQDHELLKLGRERQDLDSKLRTVASTYQRTLGLPD